MKTANREQTIMIAMAEEVGPFSVTVAEEVVKKDLSVALQFVSSFIGLQDGRGIRKVGFGFP